MLHNYGATPGVIRGSTPVLGMTGNTPSMGMAEQSDVSPATAASWRTAKWLWRGLLGS
jgi:hypothetical protein